MKSKLLAGNRWYKGFQVPAVMPIYIWFEDGREFYISAIRSIDTNYRIKFIDNDKFVTITKQQFLKCEIVK
jgi:hypothetical protein